MKDPPMGTEIKVDEIQAVCDRCRVRIKFQSPIIEVAGFLQKHVRCKFTGRRVVRVQFPCPNHQKDYQLEPPG